MERPTHSALVIACIFLSLVFVSCSSSRYQQGFSYQPAYAGPDVATGQQGENQIPAIEKTSQLADEGNRSIHQDSEESSSIHEAKEEEKLIPGLAISRSSAEVEKLADIIAHEYEAQGDSKQFPNKKELLHKMASNYAAVQNKELTTKQLRKLDRYAAKMEKKQQRHSSDVNWKPQDNLELFILLGAGVALVVGILGVGIGWFVFLGLALVYLYLKLLKNN